MEFKTNFKNGVQFVGETISEIAGAVAEKNRLRIQLNHIKGLIKADTDTRDQAYIELGRFFYENLREDASAENEAICAVIDAANDRISKASLKYVELLNIQNETKIRSENAEKLAKLVSEKAAATAKVAKEKGAVALDKAKEKGVDLAGKAKVTAADLAEKAKLTAVDLKDKAVDKADELRERFDPNKNEDLEDLLKGQEDIAEAVEEAAEEAPTAADVVEAVAETVVPETTDEESPEDAGF